MQLILHDMNDFENLNLNSTDTIFACENSNLHACTGCYGCWIKTPGVCVLKDGFENIGKLLSQCDRLTILSQCCYGSYSPSIHNVLDRSIAYALPYFETINGETHHQSRYDNRIQFSVHFYGENLSSRQKEIATQLVKANGVNLHAIRYDVFFHDNAEEAKESIL